MKILKIRHCEECKHNDYFYDTRTNLSRFVCRHPGLKTRYRTYRIINRIIALKGEIPYWCPLEDYKEIKFIYKEAEPRIFGPEVEMDTLEEKNDKR